MTQLHQQAWAGGRLASRAQHGEGHQRERQGHVEKEGPPSDAGQDREARICRRGRTGGKTTECRRSKESQCHGQGRRYDTGYQESLSSSN
jgi:hypothetical protein